MTDQVIPFRLFRRPFRPWQFFGGSNFAVLPFFTLVTMGNCLSASSTAAIADPLAHSPRATSSQFKSKNASFQPESHLKLTEYGDYTETETSSSAFESDQAATGAKKALSLLAGDLDGHETDATMPLSPDSLYSSFTASPHSDTPNSTTSPSSLLTYPTLSTRETPTSLSKTLSPTRNSLSPKRTSSFSSTTSSRSQPHRGRALQARLDKARYLQAAMASSSSTSTDGESIEVKLPLSLRNKHMNTNNAKKEVNDEFDATIDNGTVWAEWKVTKESSQDTSVTSMALSRTQASLRQDATPPLYLAVGTEEGELVVSQVVEDLETSRFVLAHMNPPSSAASEQSRSARESSCVKERHSQRVQPRVRFAHGSRIRSLDFDPTGTFLAAGGDDCLCTIYKLVTSANPDDDDEEQLVDLQVWGEIPRIDRVYAVQFSPDGETLAVGGFDGSVALIGRQAWEHGNQTECLEIDVDTEIPRDGLVYAIDWSPDSQRLAIGSSDKSCAIVNVKGTSWKVVKELRRNGSVQTVKWYPTNGKYLAIGSNDVVIVDAQTYAVKHEVDVGDDDNNNNKPRSRHSSSLKSTASRMLMSPRKGSLFKIHSMCWSPNGTYFVACGSDLKCIMLETKTFTQVHEIRRKEDTSCVVWGQESVISGIPNRYLAIGGANTTVVILKAGLELNSGASSVGDDLSSSASSLFSTKSDWTLKENMFRTVEQVVSQSSSSLKRTGADDVVAVTFSRGSRSRPSAYFAYSLADGRVVVRSTLDWRVVVELLFSYPVTCLAFSVGSRTLALATGDCKVHVFETAPSWNVIVRKDLHAPVRTLIFSKRNERLAIGSDDGSLKLLDPREKYRCVGEIDTSESGITTTDWTSRCLAIGRMDGTLSIYDSSQVCSNYCVPVAEHVLKSAVIGVAFGPSSRFLAAASNDGLVSIYSSKGSWFLSHRIRGPSGGLSCMTWNSSGRYLSVGGTDGSLQLVDTMFWSEVQECTHAATDEGRESLGSLTSMSFSQDGTLLSFAADGNGTKVLNTTAWTVPFRSKERTEEEDADDSSLGSFHDASEF